MNRITVNQQRKIISKTESWVFQKSRFKVAFGGVGFFYIGPTNIGLYPLIVEHAPFQDVSCATGNDVMDRGVAHFFDSSHTLGEYGQQLPSLKLT